MHGTIAFYGKGWGFIQSPDLDSDLFFHRTALPEQYRHRKNLADALVTFEVGEHDGKPVAIRLQIVQDIITAPASVTSSEVRREQQS